jgi:hypothetical protein
MERYEYYAFRFLTQWRENESALYTAISTNPKETDVRKALSYFQVSRNFHGIDKPGNLAFIVRSLQKVRANLSLSSPEAKVNELASVFESKFGQLNVSAASKLLWLSSRCPFIICDSRAKKALKKEFGHKYADTTYDNFVVAWRSEFTNHKKQIRDAANALPNSRPFMRAYAPSDEDLLKKANQPWFLERVFDVLLWDIGRP